MLKKQDRIFTNLHGDEPVDLASSKKRGDWNSTKKLLTNPEKIITEIMQSGLRGRGGAGFSAGRKWGFIMQDAPKPRYFIVNADESEPGACKDRDLIRYEPHKLLVGILCACYAIQANICYIYSW